MLSNTEKLIDEFSMQIIALNKALNRYKYTYLI